MRYLRFALPGAVLLLCLLGSCSSGEAALEEVAKEETVLTEEQETELTEKEEEDEEDPGDEELPKADFLGFTALSENEVIFEFSLPVTVLELDFIPELEIGSVIGENSKVTIIFEEDLEPGQLVETTLFVEDQHGNIVDVKVSFRSRNNRVPEMLITELRTEYNSPKGEFIEFKMLSNGNLGALRVFIASNYKRPLVYEFDPVEVKRGEYVVLHLRTFEEACKNEYGEDLTESGGADSSPTARDFWIPDSAELLRKNDAVYILDQDGVVLDAVVFVDNPGTAWPMLSRQDFFPEVIEFLFSQGAWKSADGTIPGPSDAVDSSRTTNTQTICRDETVGNTRTVADWYITVKSGNTPGKENNPNRFSN